MGKLTTHILDTTRGCAAAGIPVALYQIAMIDTLLVSTLSNHDGRTDSALLEGAAFTVGEYELIFQVADYFRNADMTVTHPPFLDRIAIRFCIADAAQHYHVPLLVSPWSYSTYRGS